MKNILLLLSTLIAIHAQSQIKYLPGYIITNSGVTLNGYIAYEDNITCSKHCYYKSDSVSANVTEYKPGEINSYRYENSKLYKSLTLPNNETLFVECLISGKVIVYYIEKEDGNHFYIEKDGKISEIENNKKQIVINNEEFQQNSYQYRGVLKVYFQDCPQLFSQVDGISLTKKDLIKISKKYHDLTCPDQQCTIYEKPMAKKSVFNYGIETGLMFQSIDFGTMGTNYIIFRSKSLTFPTINAFIRRNLGNDTWYFIQGKISYAHFSFEEDQRNNIRIGWGSNLYKYSYSAFLVDISVLRKFNLSKFNYFVSLGLNYNFIFNENGSEISSTGIQKKFDRFGYTEVISQYKAGKFYEPVLYGGNIGVLFEYPCLNNKAVTIGMNAYIIISTANNPLETKSLSLNMGFRF